MKSYGLLTYGESNQRYDIKEQASNSQYASLVRFILYVYINIYHDKRIETKQKKTTKTLFKQSTHQSHCLLLSIENDNEFRRGKEKEKDFFFFIMS